MLLQFVQRQWSSRKASVVAKGAPPDFVRWIQEVANVSRSYSAEEVAEALAELCVFARNENRDVADFGADLSEARVLELLPPEEFIPLVPQSRIKPVRVHELVHTLPMPAGCAGAFIGSQGAACRSLTAQLQSAAAKTEVTEAPTVQLCLRTLDGRTRPGIVELILRWPRWERTSLQVQAAVQRIHALVSELEQILAESIAAVYRRRLTRLFNRRARRAQVRREACAAYHEARRRERRAKQRSPHNSALRGLQLPPQGISRQHGGGRKDPARQRRRAAWREKRRELLRACGEMGLLQAPCARLSKQQPGQMDACRASNGFAHRPPPCGTGAARRLVQHLSACHGEVAQEALDSFGAGRVAADRPIRRPRQLRSKPSRQEKRATAIGANTAWAAWDT